MGRLNKEEDKNSQLSTEGVKKAQMIVDMILNAAQRPPSAGGVNLNRDEVYADVADMLIHDVNHDYSLIDYMNRKANFESSVKIDPPEDHREREIAKRTEYYVDLIMRNPTGQPLNREQLSKDILNLVRTEDDYSPTLIQYISQFFRTGNKDADFPMTFQETSELVSILPPRAPKELVVILKRREDGRLKVVYDGEIDVATTAGRKE